MPRKVSRNMACAICGRPTDGAPLGEYLELEASIPESLGHQRQLFGVHMTCLNAAMEDGTEVDVDLLLDDDARP